MLMGLQGTKEEEMRKPPEDIDCTELAGLTPTEMAAHP